jgi:ribonuclease VapC
MIVDSSALVAMLRGEAGADDLAETLARAGGGSVPAPCYVETCMVIAGRKGPDSRPEVDRLLDVLGLKIVAVDADHARAAVVAFLRYGKGRHPAGLNFGDCLAYAVAKAEGRPLIWVGGDFAATDVARYGAESG